MYKLSLLFNALLSKIAGFFSGIQPKIKLAVLSMGLVLISGSTQLGHAEQRLFQQPLPQNQISNSDQEAIEHIIRKQLYDLQKNQLESAFDYNSPSMQHRLVTPQRFALVMRYGYPSLFRSQRIEFYPAQQEARWVAQPVMLVAGNGRVDVMLYLMQQQDNGTWRIHGMRMQKSQSSGT